VLLGCLLIALATTNLLRLRAEAAVDYSRQTGQPCSTWHAGPEGGGELSAQGIGYARGGYR